MIFSPKLPKLSFSQISPGCIFTETVRLPASWFSCATWLWISFRISQQNFLTTWRPSVTNSTFSTHDKHSASDNLTITAATGNIFISNPNLFSTLTTPKIDMASTLNENEKIESNAPNDHTTEIYPVESSSFGLSKLMRTTSSEDLTISAEEFVARETLSPLQLSLSSFTIFHMTTTTPAPAGNDLNLGNSVFVSTDYDAKPKPRSTGIEIPNPASRNFHAGHRNPGSVAQQTATYGEFGRTKSTSKLVYNPNEGPQQLKGKIFMDRTSSPSSFLVQPGGKLWLNI